MTTLPVPKSPTTLLVDSDMFCAEEDTDSLIFCLPSVFDIPPTIVPDSMNSLLDQFQHLYQDPSEGTLPPMRATQHQL